MREAYSNELYHHGIKGQKWGVRRYQNYDGSYTRAGMKRYNDSLENYNHQVERLKEAKKSGNKADITNAKVATKLAKNKLNKDYNHLKLDKRGDKGKALYSQGYTITGKNQVLDMMTKVGGLSVAAVGISKFGGNIAVGGVSLPIPPGIKDTVNKYAKEITLAGTALTAAGAAGQIVTANKDRNLRAYYTHTSNY